MSNAAIATRPGWLPRFGRYPLPLYLGGGLIGFIILIAIFAPFVAPFDPIAQNLSVKLQPPSLAYPFGTDNFGRDILSRIIWGARIDLQMGLIGVAFPFLIGTTVGAIAGYAGRAVDAVAMRVVDIVLAFPFLVLMLAIIAILKPGLSSFYIAMALVGWRFLALREEDFVLAARSLGYSHFRILFRHILPNVLTGSIVFSMSDVVLVVLNGAAISYLGLGVQPPTAEWGIMIAEGQNFITTAWWITAFPGLTIVVMALGFSLLADGLGEYLGVRE